MFGKLARADLQSALQNADLVDSLSDVTLTALSSDRRFDHKAVGDQLGAVENLKRAIADGAVVLIADFVPPSDIALLPIYLKWDGRFSAHRSSMEDCALWGLHQQS